MIDQELAEVRSSLAGCNTRDLHEMAKELDLGYTTLFQIKAGNHKDPQYSTVRKIQEYFNRRTAA